MVFVSPAPTIKNLASSRDTLDFYFNKIYKDIIVKKKNKIYMDLKNFHNINQEMKVMVLKKTIKDFTHSYYATRSKKIIKKFNTFTKVSLGFPF